MCVGDFNDCDVSVIARSSNRATATEPVGANPSAVAVTPDGSAVYVTNAGDNTVSVINTCTNMVNTTVPVGADPSAVAVTPDESAVFVANE